MNCITLILNKVVRGGGLLAMFHISTSVLQWLASLLAVALATLHPAPRHASQHHHQPVKLPELASAQSLIALR
jgi:hypothetical protein